MDSKPLETDHGVTRQLTQFIERPKVREPIVNKMSNGENKVNMAASAAGQKNNPANTQINSNVNTDDFEDPILVTLVLFLNNRTKRNTLENTMNPTGSVDKDTYGTPDYDKVLSLLNAYSATYGTAKGEGFSDPVVSFLQAMTSKNTDYLSAVLSDSSGKPDFQKISNMVDAYETYHPKQAIILRDTTVRLLKNFFVENKAMFSNDMPVNLDNNPSLSQIVDDLDDYVVTHPIESNKLRDSFIKYLQDYANNNLTSLATVFSHMKRISDAGNLPADLKQRIEMLYAADYYGHAGTLSAAELKHQLYGPTGGFVGAIDGFKTGFSQTQLDDYGTPQIAAIGLNGELITDKKLIGRLIARKTLLYRDID